MDYAIGDKIEALVGDRWEPGIIASERTGRDRDCYAVRFLDRKGDVYSASSTSAVVSEPAPL